MMTKIVIFLCLQLSTPAFAVDPNTLESLSASAKGGPAKAAVLGDASYKYSVARRVRDPQFIVNFDLLDSMNLQVPPEGRTSEFIQEVSKSIGYLIPSANDSKELFVPNSAPNAKVKVYADGYGGPGINNNLGSGRAASKGKWNIKGIGRTKMVGPKADARHSNGGAPLSEMLTEMVLGDVLDSELPYGANRVGFLMTSDRTVSRAMGIHEQAAKSLETYTREAASIRNRDLPDLYLNLNRYSRTYAAAFKTKFTHNLEHSQKEIDRLLDSNLRSFKDASPFELVLSERKNRMKGTSVREIFNLKDGTYYSQLRVQDRSTYADVNGEKVLTEDLKKMVLSEGKVSGAQARLDHHVWVLDGPGLTDAGKRATVLQLASDTQELELVRESPWEKLAARKSFFGRAKPGCVLRGIEAAIAD